MFILRELFAILVTETQLHDSIGFRECCQLQVQEAVLGRECRTRGSMSWTYEGTEGTVMELAMSEADG
jgi:hypothetical protein